MKSMKCSQMRRKPISTWDQTNVFGLNGKMNRNKNCFWHTKSDSRVAGDPSSTQFMTNTPSQGHKILQNYFNRHPCSPGFNAR